LSGLVPQGELASWLALAGLGAFHGLNPAMGWLFAVALGLHRHSRTIVYLSLLPIALGHALSVGMAAAVYLSAGLALDARLLSAGAGLLLVGWAVYHWRLGHRHRVRIGMQTGLLGLALWSFLMATAHGAGLMLWPILAPLCFGGGAPAQEGVRVAPALAGVVVHTGAMLTVTAAIAGAVYEWVGLEMLRRAWLNVDAVWIMALALTGGWLIYAAT
jgi:hypothetical protein